MNDFIKVGWNTNFTMVPNELWDLDFLEQDHIVVFVYLARLGAADNGAFPSYPDLAQKCKIRDKNGDISKRKARTVIDKLISLGLLKKFNRVQKGTGKFGSNIYYLAHPQNLLNQDKSMDTDDYDLVLGTPCAKVKSNASPKTNKNKPLELSTPCAQTKSFENTEFEEEDSPKKSSYIDLSINTNLLKSSSAETEEKKNSFKFLEDYSLKSKTKSIIKKNFKDLTDIKFSEIYSKLKNDSRVKNLEAALISFLNGDWEEFEQPDKSNKIPKNTRGDSITIKKIKGNFKTDQDHILESEAETTRLLEVYEELTEEIQETILAEAKLLYLKESDNKSFDSLNQRIFNSTKNAFITRILKERKFE